MTEELELDIAEVDLSSLPGLEERRDELVKRRGEFLRMYRALISVAIIFVVLATLAVIFFWRSMKPLWILVGATYVMIPIAFLPTYRMRLADYEADIQELDFQIDLQKYAVTSAESRAEKTLRINDHQLRRYYDLNLSQNRWVFGLGVVCIVLGAALVAGTLYLVLNVAKTPEAQVVTAILGGAGALFTNGVAAIYLRMNAAASDSLATFHTKLVDTNRCLLANLLASRISDPAKRDSTLAELAAGLTERQGG